MTIHFRPQALTDIDESTDWLDQNANPATSDRFAEAIIAQTSFLDRMPLVGTADSRIPHLPGLRRRVVQGFPSYVIYYLPVDDGITIVRVLHGSRDSQSILKHELPP